MISTRIAGIPCQVQVIGLGRPAQTQGDPNDCYPAEGPEVQVFDRKGYRARWLEDKMTDEDYWRILEESA